MFRVASGVMAALFALAAAVQYNDPDPLRWIAIYLAACVVAVVATVRGEVSPVPTVLTGLIALVWATSLVTGGGGLDVYARMFDTWEMRSPTVEEAREASGLAIVALWMAVTVARRRPRATR